MHDITPQWTGTRPDLDQGSQKCCAVQTAGLTTSQSPANLLLYQTGPSSTNDWYKKSVIGLLCSQASIYANSSSIVHTKQHKDAGHDIDYAQAAHSAGMLSGAGLHAFVCQKFGSQLGTQAAHTRGQIICGCVQAAQGAGMLSVAVPPALSARGRFPAADATFDGFGYGGGLNWPRLQMLLDKRKERAKL